MPKGLAVVAAALLFATRAEARLLVLPTITGFSAVLSGGPDGFGGPLNNQGNPVRLLSFDVNSTVNGFVYVTRSADGLLGTVVAGQTAHFEPAVALPSLARGGFWYSQLWVEDSPGVHKLATFSNITIELGDDILPLPEPATWALMIAGFGIAGTALRRHPAVQAVRS